MLRSNSNSSLPILEEPDVYRSGSGTHIAIEFHLPARRRLIPYSWLLYSEVNREETEWVLCYTHCMVTVEGEKLGGLQDEIQGGNLKLVRELPHSPGIRGIRVLRITITEKA